MMTIEMTEAQAYRAGWMALKRGREDAKPPEYMTAPNRAAWKRGNDMGRISRQAEQAER